MAMVGVPSGSTTQSKATLNPSVLCFHRFPIMKSAVTTATLATPEVIDPASVAPDPDACSRIVVTIRAAMVSVKSVLSGRFGTTAFGKDAFRNPTTSRIATATAIKTRPNSCSQKAGITPTSTANSRSRRS